MLKMFKCVHQAEVSAFSYAGPAAWNALPASLHDITDISKFKRSLKTILFE